MSETDHVPNWICPDCKAEFYKEKAFLNHLKKCGEKEQWTK